MYHLANTSINMSGGKGAAYKVVLSGTLVHTKYQCWFFFLFLMIWNLMIWMAVFTVALSKTRGIIGPGTTPTEQFWVVKKMDQGSVSEVGEQAENGDEELGPKRGAMLAVWKFLGFKNPDIGQMSIFCKCCWAKVVGAGSNMSNLIHHISRKHVFEYQECRSASSTSAGNVGSGTAKKIGVRCRSKTRLQEGLTKETNGGWTL